MIAPLSATLEERYTFDAQNRLSRIDYKKTVGQTVTETSAGFEFDEQERIKVASGSTPAGPVDVSYAYQARSASSAPDMLASITERGSAQAIAYQRGSMANAPDITALQYSDMQNLLSAYNTKASGPNDLNIQCGYDAMNRFVKSVVKQTWPIALNHEVSYLFRDGAVSDERVQSVPRDPANSEHSQFIRANGVLLGRIILRPDPPTPEASFAEIFATDISGSVMGVFAYQKDSILQSTYYTYDAYGRRTEFNAA